MKRIEAPFSDAEVARLQRWQDSPQVHPYTCPLDDTDPETHRETNRAGETKLIPERGGMRCPACNYTQRWAHDFEPPEDS